MRYFRNGNRVARVDIDVPRRPEHKDEWINARVYTYNFKRKDWVERPNLASEILFTGEWGPARTLRPTDAIVERKLKQFV